MARTPRKWQGARTPSGLKRVRQAERRRAILQPRRSAAKTLIAKALTTATAEPESASVATSLYEAIAALDRAAKAGAIHPNAAARRKSRLARKVNAAVGGSSVVSAGHVAKSTGKAAAVKAAKARIAAGKAVKAKGAQTAAGKARAALSKSTRADTAHAAATPRPRRDRRLDDDRRQAGREGDDGSDDEEGPGQGVGRQGAPRRPRRRRRRPPRPRRRRRRPRRPSSRDPRDHRRPGHRPGRFEFGRCRQAAVDAGWSSGRRRVRRAVHQPAAQRPAHAQDEQQAGARRLLPPVERGEGVDVGDPGGLERRARARSRGSADRRSRRRSGT